MEPIMGQIQIFAFNFAPRYWMPCEGQVLPIGGHEALFSLVGTTYGGDGRTNFALPNLKGKAPAEHLQYCIAIQGVYPQRQ